MLSRLLSRSASPIGILSRLRIQKQPYVVATRNGHKWNYRTVPMEKNKKVLWVAEVVQGVVWWWIMWHFYTCWDAIVGEFPYPDPSKWPDDMLGVPEMPPKKTCDEICVEEPPVVVDAEATNEVDPENGDKK